MVTKFKCMPPDVGLYFNFLFCNLLWEQEYEIRSKKGTSQLKGKNKANHLKAFFPSINIIIEEQATAQEGNPPYSNTVDYLLVSITHSSGIILIEENKASK
ncbi:hypothetical protein OSB04_025794 [Centaurea solstitialis]|uniref:Uncharacterized protein n=1 Tax=Centaurea solstitialis TaxID=347529 RepID=A0AA38T768_9ASTR|nr:hypothetical protein OSB04_025794 [Centaurea solstitialis]